VKQIILLIDNKNIQAMVESIFDEALSERIEYYSVSVDDLMPELHRVEPNIIVIMVSEQGRKLMDIIRTIRRKEVSSEIPILVMVEEVAVAETLLDGGATVVLESPVSSSELINRIQHLLGIPV
jgi:DNA-binding response OmpR family regulator